MAMVDFSTQWGSVTDALGNGSFDPVGANNSYAFNAPFNPLPSLPSVGSFAPSQTTPGAGVITSGGNVGSNTNIAPAGATTAAPSNAAATAQPTTAGGIQSGSLADYFYRVVIVVLGFIFVAVGLHMFAPSVVPNVVNAVKPK
jgi:hypothetical protein